MKQRTAIYIVADDLTGSADAANYFRTATKRVRVSFLPETPWLESSDGDVVQVYDSESRSLNLVDAKRRTTNAGQKLVESECGPFFIYKKVDSTLRGCIGGEIEGLLCGLGRHLAVLAPSFPNSGRVVHGGELLLNGVPVSQTPISKDPHTPVLLSRVADIVRQTTNLRIIELNHTVIDQGVEAIAEYLGNIDHENAIIVADAETDAHLSIIAEALSEHPEILPCGSAGLALQLSKIWCDEESATTANYKPPICKKVFVAVGSANPVSHEQLTRLTGMLDTKAVVMEPRLLAEPETNKSEIVRVGAEIENQLKGKVVAVTLKQERANRNPSLEGTFESDLANVAYDWWRQMTYKEHEMIGFVATGGDTALALCYAFSAKAIWPEGEVESGIPWSWMEMEDGNFPLVTKAGGLGTTHALSHSVEFLLNTH